MVRHAGNWLIWLIDLNSMFLIYSRKPNVLFKSSADEVISETCIFSNLPKSRAHVISAMVIVMSGKKLHLG